MLRRINIQREQTSAKYENRNLQNGLITELMSLI